MALVVQNTKKLQYNRNEYFFFLKYIPRNLSTIFQQDTVMTISHSLTNL